MKFLRRLKQFGKDEGGDALVIGAVGMVAIVAFAGLAIDVGQVRYETGKLQAAADAAALAAELEVGNCGSSHACANMKTAAKQALIENGFSSGSITAQTQQCPPSSASSLTLTINQGPCVLGSTANDPNYGNAQYVEAEIQYPQTMTFASVVGFTTMKITVRSEAGPTGSTNCIYLSTSNTTTSGPTGLLVQGGSGGSISASCGIVDDSGSSNALESNSGTVSATSISVVGGWSPDNGGTFTPTPKTSQTAVTDPLSYLTAPAEGTIQQSGNYTPSNGATLQPGAYLGGININSGVSVTLSGGTYYLGGSLVNSGTITGNGVTIYFSSGSMTMNSGSTANLVAPTSGTYAGILIYQNPSDTSAIIVDSGATSKYQGVIYATGAQLTLNSGGNTAAYTILDVNSLILDSGAVFSLGDDYSSLSGGSPIKGAGAVLVE